MVVAAFDLPLGDDLSSPLFFHSCLKNFFVMSKNLFNSVKLVRPRSSKFDLSHTHTTSCNMGKLIPVFNRACIPGDRWKCGQQALARFAPLVGPMYHLVNIFFHSYFVPYRLVWKNWENAITNTQVAGVVPALPYLDVAGQDEPLLEYMGIGNRADIGAESSFIISPLMLAAYQLIWNDYYRDQNLNTPLFPSNVPFLDDGNNFGKLATLVGLRGRNWEHDYLTSAMPTAQKGTAVDIPLGNVVLKDVPLTDRPIIRDQTTGAAMTGTLAGEVPTGELTAGGTPSAVFDPNNTLGVDATTIRDLRRAMALQRFLERQMVGGTRYNEQIWSQFGVDAGDSRLNRPEYIGGTKTAVRVSEVLQTSETGSTPQGNMAGHAMAVVNGGYSDYFVKEHGCIITLMSVMPRTGYFRGCDREFLKINDMFDFFWPDLEHIGEQEIFNREVNIAHASPAGTFGYSPRYAEYKHASNRISGDMQSTLLSWNMARDVSAAAALNASFVNCDATLRVFADTDPFVDHIWIQVFNDCKVRRLMSLYSTPHG